MRKNEFNVFREKIKLNKILLMKKIKLKKYLKNTERKKLRNFLKNTEKKKLKNYLKNIEGKN